MLSLGEGSLKKKEGYFCFLELSQPKLKHNATSTVVGCDMKLTVHTTPPPHSTSHKLNAGNISAVNDPISTYL